MRISESQLRRIIRETIVSASQEYIEGPEAAMSRTQEALVRRLIALLPEPGSVDHIRLIQDSMDESGVIDASQRDMISRALKMIPPKIMISQSLPRSRRSNIE